jgi:hypothetical protein
VSRSGWHPGRSRQLLRLYPPLSIPRRGTPPRVHIKPCPRGHLWWPRLHGRWSQTAVRFENGVLRSKTPSRDTRHPSLPRRGTPPRFHGTPRSIASTAGGSRKAPSGP